MERIEICVPDQVMDRVRKIAAARETTPEDLIALYIEIGIGQRSIGEAVPGMFADEADFLGELIEHVMREREQRNELLTGG